MFQELGFHMPRVQTSSYHIYERDSAGDEALRLGSETEVLYLLTSTCSSVIVGPPQKTLSICDLGGCLGNLSPVTLIDLCKFDWVPKTLLFLFSMKKSGCIVLSDLVLSLPSLVICLSVVCRVCRILLWCNPFEHSSDPFVCTTNTGILLQILRQNAGK